MQREIASEENGVVKGTVKLFYYNVRSPRVCGGTVSVEGKFENGKLTMEQIGQRASGCTFSFSVTKRAIA